MFGREVDLYFTGRIFAGLLAQKASVRLAMVSWISGSCDLAVEHDGTKLAIDLSDCADRWDEKMLDWCDVYAKRNVQGPMPDKVVPFGLHCSCHSRRSAMRVWPLAQSVRALYCYLVTPHWRDLEYSYDETFDPVILAQIRVWEPKDAPGDQGINDERIGLLRSLRSAFGSRVLGGVVPTPFAQRLCPDLITEGPCRQPQYIRWARRPAIGIYVRGLFDSIGFKMAEYMASSKCIISQPILNDLPEPISHLEIYRSTDECIAHCDDLLSHPARIQERRRASWEYYQRNVKPEVHMAKLLK